MTSLIGASLPDPEALGKVTGESRYVADLIQPGMLHLQVVFAHRPHARIRSIHTEAALRQPGVIAVFTAADVPYNALGYIPDRPVLCDDVVRFEGDKVALVVAEDKASAEAGAKLVAVEYEDLPALIDPIAAMAADAPRIHAGQESNVLLHVPIRKGDTARAFAEADVVLADTFTTSWQEHAFLQPEGAIAYLDEEGRLVIETAGQGVHDDRRQIAWMLRLPEEQVIVRYATIGGAFGGKEDLSVQPLVALATWKLRRPSALVWSREESIIGHHKRHPMRIRCRWGAQKDGRITAVEAELIADGGAYVSTSTALLPLSTLLLNGCYEVPHIAVDGYVVYTNNVPSGAFRGFGATQVMFASEIMVTRLAHALQIDPVELRRRNIYREDSLGPLQQTLPPGVSALPLLERCIEEAHTRLHYDQPREQSAPHLRRGIGIACGMKNIGIALGFPEQATATVELFGKAEPERAIVRVGAAELGQGTHLILRQIAAEALGLPFACVTMVCDDSSQAPDAGSALASRMTLVGGQAVREAALAAREQWSLGDDDHIVVTRQFHPPATTPIASGGSPVFCHGYAAQAVEVEVNMLTGQVQVLRVISVHDVGRAINRQKIEGQIEGGLAQALGFALYEHLQISEGRILTPNFTTYLLPTIADMPTEITSIILELADSSGPYGARGVGEMSLLPLAPAIASAIHDATGVWLTRLPMTPERVLEAITQPAPTHESTKEREIATYASR